METLTINGEEYIKKSQVRNDAATFEGMEYKIVRTYSAGVFAGYLDKVEGDVATLKNARRLWYWDGAASLSQLAEEGTSKPENCKFPQPVKEIILRNWVEIISVSEVAKKSIEGVNEWKV